MADKTINELTAATTMGNDDLLVLQQGGTAKKLSGKQLGDYVYNAAAEKVAEVNQAVDDARESINDIVESVQSMTELGTDTTLTTTGMAADAKAAGDKIEEVEAAATAVLSQGAAIESMIAGRETAMEATKNYTSGSLVIVNDTLYKLDANVASGESLIPEINCHITTVEAVITSRVPSSRTVNGKTLSSDITLTAEDIVYDDSLSEHTSGSVGEAVSDMITVKYSENLLNPAAVRHANINETTGEVFASDYYDVSGKIECRPSDNLYVAGYRNGVIALDTSAYIWMAFYQADGTFIEIQKNTNPFIAPNETAYCYLRTNLNRQTLGINGVFLFPISEMHGVWIPYSEKKEFNEDYIPEQISEDIASLKTFSNRIIISPTENLIDESKITFRAQGANNAISTMFSLEPEMTYTWTWVTNFGGTCYVRFYDSEKQSVGRVVLNRATDGVITATTPANTAYCEFFFYASSGLDFSSFSFANICMVYGNTPAIVYKPYNERIAAKSIPALPDIAYKNEFNAIKSVAHMGQSYYFPQNTIWSWLGAKKSGFDYIECDLQVTADNQIVLIHDPDMRRYGGTAEQTVASLTLAQLREFDAGAWFNKAYTGTVFPLFDEMVGVAKALGMKLALDCKTIDTAERVDAVAAILEKWGMVDEAYWITGNFSLVWNRLPDAEICFAAGATLIEGSFADTAGGWFNNYASNFPADHRQSKTVTIDVNGTPTDVTGYIAADGVKFAVAQNYTVGDTYGLSSLQKEAEYAKAFSIKYELYAVDSDEAIYNYVQNIPELYSVSSNRTTVQAATCRKFGIGLSDRPQNIGETELA